MNPLNYSTISFPSLGLEWNPGRGFSLGPLSVRYYGLIIALGLVLAVVYACRRSKQFGIKEDDILDGVLWVTPLPSSAPELTTASSPGTILPPTPSPCCISGKADLPFTAVFWVR